jgi:hypothetical protein
VKAEGKVLVGSYSRLHRDQNGKRRIERVSGSHALAEQYTKIHLADWDGDGLFDILIGYTRTMVLLTNDGTAAVPHFQAPRLLVPPKGGFPGRPNPFLYDWDGDGRTDLLVGAGRGGITFFRNLADKGEPRFAKGVPLKAGGKVLAAGMRTRFTVTDWNGDGVPDLLVGNFFSRRDPDAPRGRTMGGYVILFRGVGNPQTVKEPPEEDPKEMEEEDF